MAKPPIHAAQSPCGARRPLCKVAVEFGGDDNWRFGGPSQGFAFFSVVFVAFLQVGSNTSSSLFCLPQMLGAELKPPGL